MSEKINLGKQIKYFRTSYKLTQEQLAEAMDVSVGAISKWESGANTPELPMIIRLAKLFEVSVDVLLDYEVEKNTLEAKIEELKELKRQRKTSLLQEKSEFLLLKYPNNFEVVYMTAKNNFFAALDKKDGKAREKYYERSLELLEKSLSLIDQNKDPKINEISIKAEKAMILYELDNVEEAVKAIEAININNFYSSRIALWRLEKNNKNKEDMERIRDYLETSLLHVSAELVNTCMGYINYYFDINIQEFELGLKISQIAQLYLESLVEEGKSTYFDRIRIILLVADAIGYESLGEFDKTYIKLKEAKELAERFDAKPTTKFSIPFLSIKNDSYAFDNIGDSMLAFMDSIINGEFQADKKDLKRLWKEIREERGGRK